MRVFLRIIAILTALLAFATALVTLITLLIPLLNQTNNPTATNPETSKTVEVKAEQGWQNTGITVAPGDSVVIEYVSGTWTGGIGAGNWYDGEGDLLAGYKCAELQEDPSSCQEDMPDVYNGTLIGRIASDVFAIGNYKQFTSTVSGNLFLRMNDIDEGLFDNEGSLMVRVSVNR